MQSETLALVFCVGAGAAIGGIIRFGATKIIDTSAFPWATFAVNLVACFFAAFLAVQFTGSVSEGVRLFFTVGLMGGLSTMSTFTTETIDMLYAGSYGNMALNIFLNVVVCLIGAISGRELGLALS